MDFVVPPLRTPSITVAGEHRCFPVRRIFCVGRNYAAHAREMGKDPDRELPFFFTKPADAVVPDGATIVYPPLTRNFHYEAELVVAVNKAGADIPVAEAGDYIFGYAVGNDLTRRDLQLEARDKGRPWDWGKAFDNSAACGPIHRVSDVGHFDHGTIRLTVNGVEKQSADLADMIWTVPEIVSILSQSIRVAPGDLIYTGTPAGVGPLVPGDVCTITIDGLGSLTTTIAEHAAQ